MTTTLQRLIKHPHAAVFDKSPAAELALRLRHPYGATWSIDEGVMTAAVGASAFSYQLQSLTVGGLAAALVADGFEVLSLSPVLSEMSAMVLVEGAGDQGVSNGDHIQGFTSLLWALYSAYSGELSAAKYQIGQALHQMVITQAEGEWLDLWGALYAETRLTGETDAEFATRIPKDVFRIRVNKFGIEDAIKDVTGWDVRIDEPWREIFTLDHSTLSGPDCLYDGERYGYHLIRPFTRDAVHWPDVLSVIERNRAAGVLVIGGDSLRSSAEVVVSGSVASSGVHSRRSRHQIYEDRALLDFTTIEAVSILNHPARHQREVLHTSSSVIAVKGWGSDVTWSTPGLDWVSTPYIVHFQTKRDFRTAYMAVDYSGVWPSLRTWESINSSWADFKVIVSTSHTRS